MKKRIVSGIIGLSLLISGCSNASTATTTLTNTSQINTETTVATLDQVRPTWQDGSQPVTLTMTSQITEKSDECPFPVKPSDWGKDEISRMMINLTGINLNIVHQSYLNAPDLEVQWASQEYTDLVAIRVEKDALFMENSGFCYSLDELADQYCPDFWNNIDPVQKLNNQAADGKIYTLRNGYYNDEIYRDPRIAIFAPWTLNVNDKLMENQTLPISIEQLEDILYEAADTDGIIPLAMLNATESPLAGWMGLTMDVYWDETVKGIRSPLRQEGWLDYLQMMNRWYRNGILHMPEQELIASNPYGAKEWLVDNLSNTLVFASPANFNLDGSYYSETITEKDPWPWTVMKEPLLYENKDQAVAYDIKATNAYNPLTYTATNNREGRRESCLFITTNCVQKDRAIAFMQFLMSEDGSKLTHWGIEGNHYTLDENNLPIYTKAFRNESIDLADSGRVGHLLLPDDGLQYWFFAGNDKIGALLDSASVAYNTNATVLKMRAQQIEAGLNYKKLLAENKCPVLQFAMPNVISDDHNVYSNLVQTWKNGMQSIVTECHDEDSVKTAWEALMNDLAIGGLDRIEKSMTIRFKDAMQRYQSEGYYLEFELDS